MTNPPPTAAVPPRPRWARLTLWAVLATAVLAAAAADGVLYVGPTRPAFYRGKRVAPGQDYRVSYAYADGDRLASDTDHVGERYFFAVHRDAPMAVRTFGFGTLRLARLAGTNPAAAGWAAGRWAAILGGIAALSVVSRRRRPVAAAAPAPGSLAGGV